MERALRGDFYSCEEEFCAKDFARIYHDIVSSHILEYGRFCSEQISESERGESVLEIMENTLDAQLETDVVPIVLLKFALKYSEYLRLFDHAGKHFMREAEVPKFLSLEEPSLETISVNTQNQSLQSFLSDETKILCTAFIIEDGISLETYLDALLQKPHTVQKLAGEEIITLKYPIPALAFEKVDNDRVAVYKLETSTLRNYFDGQRMRTVYPMKED